MEKHLKHINGSKSFELFLSIIKTTLLKESLKKKF